MSVVILLFIQLPAKPSGQPQGPSSSAPPAGAYNPYSPAMPPTASAPLANAPPAPHNIGFENLSSMFTFRDSLLPVII